MRPEVLLCQPIDPVQQDRLAEGVTIHHLPAGPDAAPLSDDVLGRIRAVATFAGIGVEPALVARMPALELIAVNGVGLDRVDLEVARQRDIRVTTTQGVLNADVADCALMLMLACSRRMIEADAHVRDGKWEAGSFPLTRTLRGKRLGIFGLGGIGAEIARLASAFDMQIAYTNRRERTDVPYRYEPALPELAAWADILVLIAPGGAETRHVVNARVLEALGPQGMLINVARGSLVDETALIAALEDGRLGTAGLDVFEAEPHVPEGLRRCERVVLQPHVGSGTVETRMAMAAHVVDNILAQMAGAPLKGVVV